MAKLTKEQIALQKEAKELQQQSIITAEQYTSILKEINKVQAGQNTTLAAIIAKHKTLNKTLNETDKLSKKIVDSEYQLIDLASTLQSSLVDNKKEFVPIDTEYDLYGDDD